MCATKEVLQKAGQQKRLLIADDHRLVRELVKRLINSCTDVEVCGEAEDGIDAVAKAQALRPDVVVLDVSMPRMNGFAAAAKIKEILPNLYVIIFSEYKNVIPETMLAPSDISACFSKSDGLDGMIEEIRRS